MTKYVIDRTDLIKSSLKQVLEKYPNTQSFVLDTNEDIIALYHLENKVRKTDKAKKGQIKIEISPVLFPTIERARIYEKVGEEVTQNSLLQIKNSSPHIQFPLPSGISYLDKMSEAELDSILNELKQKEMNLNRNEESIKKRQKILDDETERIEELNNAQVLLQKEIQEEQLKLLQKKQAEEEVQKKQDRDFNDLKDELAQKESELENLQQRFDALELKKDAKDPLDADREIQMSNLMADNKELFERNKELLKENSKLQEKVKPQPTLISKVKNFVSPSRNTAPKNVEDIHDWNAEEPEIDTQQIISSPKLPTSQNNQVVESLDTIRNMLDSKLTSISNNCQSKNTSQQSVVSKLDIPVLEELSMAGVESYIELLLNAAQILPQNEHKILIFNSMLKSKRNELLINLSQEEQTDIYKFIRFLRQTYCSDPFLLRKEIEGLAQKSTETASNFFRRCVREYKRSKSIDVVDDKELYTNSIFREDLRYLFCKGLLNTKLKEKVLTTDINFDQLADQTMKWETLFKRNETVISVISSCYKCGSNSHGEADCQASPKNRRDFNKKRSQSRSQSPRYRRNSRSNSRQRSGSRGRSPSREYHQRRYSPYYGDRYRSWSRGRSSERNNQRDYGRNRQSPSRRGYYNNSNRNNWPRNQSRERRFNRNYNGANRGRNQNYYRNDRNYYQNRNYANRQDNYSDRNYGRGNSFSPRRQYYSPSRDRSHQGYSNQDRYGRNSKQVRFQN